jgi:hypothetical protein
MSLDQTERPIEGRTCWPNTEMAELSLLLPGWQASEMECRAYSLGLTLGQLIRLLVRDYLARPGGP